MCVAGRSASAAARTAAAAAPGRRQRGRGPAGGAAAQTAGVVARHAAAAGVLVHLGPVGAASGDAAPHAAPRVAHAPPGQHGLCRRGGRRSAPRDPGGVQQVGRRRASRHIQRTSDRRRRPRARASQDLRAVRGARRYGF